MGDNEAYYDEEDHDGEQEEKEELPPERVRDGEFDYENTDGVVVPKDSIY